MLQRCEVFLVTDDENGDVSPMIQEDVNFCCSLSLLKPAPLEKAEIKTDGGGAWCIERIFKCKFMIRRFGQTLGVKNLEGFSEKSEKPSAWHLRRAQRKTSLASRRKDI